MKKILLLSVLLAFYFRGFAQAPVVTSFSPASGPIGTVVTINGTNFSPVAANNIVHFGGVTGPVVSATSTTLTVKVPDGSTYEPLTVTTNSLTGYGPKPFNVTFNDGNTVFSPTSFSKSTDLGLNNNLCYDARRVVLADFDGDGKPDVAVNNPNVNNIQIIKNISNGSGPVFGVGATLTLTTGTTPLELVDADFDGDGLIDLAVINRVSNTISIFKNTSTTAGISFAPKIDLSTVATPSSITLGDVDGDGKPDIVVGSNASNIVSVYRNISDASGIKFAPKIDYQVSGSYDITIRDMNGDGKPELVIALYTNNQVGIMKNESTPGTIKLDNAVTFASGSGPQMVTVFDVDGDGLPDMVVPCYTGSLWIYRNTSTSGSFSFTPTQVYQYIVSSDFAYRDAIRASHVNSFPFSNPITASAADLDGDGKADLILTYRDQDIPSVIKNLSTPGNIKFANNEEYNDLTPYVAGAVDLDGDGKPDLVMGTEQTGSVYWNKNMVTEPTLIGYQTANNTTVTINGTNLSKTSSLTIGGKAVTYTINSATGITATVAANVSGSIVATTPYGTATLPGFTNVPPPVIKSVSPASGPVGNTVTIAGSHFSTSQDVFFGSSKATVTANSATALKVTVPYGSEYQPVKVTANGLTAYSNTNFNTTFPGGTSTFTANSLSAKSDIATGYGRPISLTQADFDGDGHIDIAFAGSGNYATTIYLFKNTGNVQAPFPYTPTSVVTASGSPIGIATGDFDGDGKPDLVVANNQTETLSVFKNTSTVGNLSFGPKSDFPTYYNPTHIFVGDLDGDGKPDIVSVSNGNYYSILSVYHNISANGVIAFAHQVDYFTTGSGSEDVIMSDIDGDGKLDVVVSGRNGICIFPNTSVNGAITFGTIVTINTTGSNVTMAAGDLDGDGKPDLALITASNGISTFKNTSTIGNFSFAAPQLYLLPTSTTASYIAINDLNGDGKPDIMVADDNSNFLSVFKNISTSSALALDTRVDYPTGNTPEMIASADFNNDGKPDIAVASLVNGGFSLFLNQQKLPQSQTITFNALKNIIYGAQDILPGATSSSGDVVSYTSSDTTIATIVSNKIHIKGAGTVTITALQKGDSTYAAATSVPQSITIAKAPVTITAVNMFGVSGLPLPALQFTVAGLVYNQTLAVFSTQPIPTAVIPSNPPTGTYPITVNGAAAANYTFTYQQGTLTLVSQAFVSTPFPVKTYGDKDFAEFGVNAPGVNYTSNNTQVATIVNGNIHIVGAGTVSITATNQINQISKTLTVNKAPLTVTANSNTTISGYPIPALTVTYSGFVNGDVPASITTPPVTSTTATSSSPTGYYPINVGGGVSANYTFTYVPGVLTMAPSWYYSYTIPVKTYGNADFLPFGISAAGITYTSSNPSVATIVNGNIHITGAGTSIINASNGSLGLNKTLTVNKDSLIIWVHDQTKVAGQANPALTFTYVGFVNGDTQSALTTLPVISTTANNTSGVGYYPITATGAAAKNYYFIYENGTLTVTSPTGNSLPVNTAVLDSTAVNTFNTANQTSTTFSIKAYPNPAVDVLNLQIINGDNHNTATITVRNLQGKVVYKVTGDASTVYQFGQNFKVGVYVADIVNGKFTRQVKLIKAVK